MSSLGIKFEMSSFLEVSGYRFHRRLQKFHEIVNESK